ncbi:hypothetical protein HPP92_000802 [Vanilla planifolia]|uniref:Deoxyuridine 5'-triphosphate nucleotidohydrolase n=1 Tax=Vanilla planifolia TaxID=51239 RepID=A0A835S5J3_VANPL|nr:hypothetical protein HPP92_000802 [Vanilla planifolia]
MAGAIIDFPRMLPTKFASASNRPPYARILLATRSRYVLPSLNFAESMAANGLRSAPGNREECPGLASLKVKKLSANAVLPSRASSLAAGYDISSAAEAKVIARGKALIPTDLSIAIPEGTYARIAPRSGLAWKHSIDVGAGVIDADYRGPLGVVLFNHSDVDFEVKAGDRIAQLIIERIMTPVVLEVDDLEATKRGSGGFGSTGV